MIAGCPEMARQKIMSILHHTSNCHIFPSFPLFSQCEHEDLNKENRPWIAPGSLAMAKLRKAVCGDDNKNLDDLKYMTGKVFTTMNLGPYWCLFITEFIHTGDIESMNNLQLKYANKTFSYRFVIFVNYVNHTNFSSWLSMIIRASLCALDWNYNVNRPHKQDVFGHVLKVGDSSQIFQVTSHSGTGHCCWQKST